MSVRIFGTPVCVHPLLWPAVALALYMREGESLIYVTVAVLLHELCHVAAAHALHIQVTELELMPFGGAARMEPQWMLRPTQMVLVALAGPLMNLMLILLAAALCEWGALGGREAALVIKVNLTVMAFNLLPALPLDGGRILCGLLSLRMRPQRALAVGVWLGRALGGVLVILAAASAVGGRFNLTLALAGAYLILSGRREMRQADGAALRSLIDRQREMTLERALPLQWLAASREATVRDVILKMRPRRAHMVAVFDERMRLTGCVAEYALLDALLDDGGRTVGALADDEWIDSMKAAAASAAHPSVPIVPDAIPAIPST